jgi:hypothetical protein
MNWFFWRKPKVEWSIRPFDIHWMGFETSYVIRDGWEPYGVTPVPNALDQNQIRLWTRRPLKYKKRTYEIKIQSGSWGGHQVLLHLSDGWEPFAVSDSSGNHIIWFRKGT